jgi:hypothetical protein
LGRKEALLGFWLVGYLIGFIAWLGKSSMIQFIENIGISAQTAEALLAGLFGSTIMVLGVLIWSFLSSTR